MTGTTVNNPSQPAHPRQIFNTGDADLAEVATALADVVAALPPTNTVLLIAAPAVAPVEACDVATDDDDACDACDATADERATTDDAGVTMTAELVPAPESVTARGEVAGTTVAATSAAVEAPIEAAVQVAAEAAIEAATESAVDAAPEAPAAATVAFAKMSVFVKIENPSMTTVVVAVTPTVTG